MKWSVLSLIFLCSLLAGKCFAQVTCAVKLTSPVPAAVLSGTPTVKVTDTCTGGGYSFNALYVMPPGGSPATTFWFAQNSGSYSLDTTQFPNGQYRMDVIAWDGTATHKFGQTAQDTFVTISNAAVPTPVTTPAPTSRTGPVACAVTLLSPATGASISRIVPVSVNDTCTGGSYSFNALYVTSAGGVTNTYWFAQNSGSFSLDTTQFANGQYHMDVIAWNNTATVKYGQTAQDSIVTVANAAVSPTPSARPTATPSKTPTLTRTPAPTARPTPSLARPTPTPVVSAASPTPPVLTPTSTAPVSTPTPVPVTGSVVRANDFLNSMGAVTHDIQGLDSPGSIVSGFQYTGLRIGRDDGTYNLGTNTTGGGLVQDLCNIHTATINAATNPAGVLYHELPLSGDLTNTQAQWDYLAGCGAMLEAEGPNEPNNQPFAYKGVACNAGSTFLGCAEFQRDLYAMVKNDPALKNFKVAGITEVGAEPDDVGLQFLTIPSGSGLSMPDGTVYADIANAHNYVQGNGPAATTLIDNQARLAESVQSTSAYSSPTGSLWDLYGEYWGHTWNKGFAAGSTGQFDRPKESTENGWNVYVPGANIGTDKQGRLLTDLYLDGYQMGFSETIMYKLFDENGDAGNGMFCNDLQSQTECNSAAAPGTSGDATLFGRYVHNLTTILSDNSSGFTPKALNVSVSNLPPTGYYQLMEKSNGIYELAVWGEAFASELSTPVTVSLGASYAVVNVYDITAGTTPVSKLSNVNSATLNLNDHAIIVEFHN
jgi:hypothetical protein